MDATGKLPRGGLGDTCFEPLPEDVRPTALMEELAGGWQSKIVNLVPRKLDLQNGGKLDIGARRCEESRTD
jgi:hypothetical protein